MFDNLAFSSLRLIALLSHFVLTYFLLWTKYDSLLVTLSSSATINDYNQINDIHTGLISLGISALGIEIIFFASNPQYVSLFSAIKLFLDFVACFFIAWMVLDGLSWITYIYILVFCV